MSDIANPLRRELRGDKEYAEGYAESYLNSYIATQIKVLREQRGLSQPRLANLIGTTQSGISRIENVNYSSWNIGTLKKLARAFDVRLKVSFEPYGTLPDEVDRFSRESLQRPDRRSDPGLADVVPAETHEAVTVTNFFGNPNLQNVTYTLHGNIVGGTPMPDVTMSFNFGVPGRAAGTEAHELPMPPISVSPIEQVAVTSNPALRRAA
jgi:transcriptional regulator with XRE-family HTH domain